MFSLFGLLLHSIMLMKFMKMAIRTVVNFFSLLWNIALLFHKHSMLVFIFLGCLRCFNLRTVMNSAAVMFFKLCVNEHMHAFLLHLHPGTEKHM